MLALNKDIITELLEKKDVDLSNRNIDDNTGVSIAYFVWNNRLKFNSLNLSNNKIGERGVKVFSAALAANVDIQSLNLAKNSLPSVVVAEIICGTLASNTKLQTLNVSGTVDTCMLLKPEKQQQCLTKIKEALASNTTLLELNLTVWEPPFKSFDLGMIDIPEEFLMSTPDDILKICARNKKFAAKRQERSDKVSSLLMEPKPGLYFERLPSELNQQIHTYRQAEEYRKPVVV